MKTEKIEYFGNEEERDLNYQIVEYTKRIRDLGKERAKIIKSKKIDEKERISKLETIDNDAKYYLSKINNATRLLYGGVRC